MVFRPNFREGEELEKILGIGIDRICSAQSGIGVGGGLSIVFGSQFNDIDVFRD